LRSEKSIPLQHFRAKNLTLESSPLLYANHMESLDFLGAHRIIKPDSFGFGGESNFISIKNFFLMKIKAHSTVVPQVANSRI